jgi:hypothetical protein
MWLARAHQQLGVQPKLSANALLSELRRNWRPQDFLNWQLFAATPDGYNYHFLAGFEAIDLIAICELLLLSKVSVSKAIEYWRTRRRRTKNDDAITTTTTTTEILTPFQAQRVLLIGRLRELVINGHSPLAIQAELGISQRQYYRIYQKAFEHDCKLIEQWDSDTFREDLAIYKARRQKILAFLIDKMEDPNAHDITRLKAAQLAAELSNAMFRASSEGEFQVKNQARSDINQRDSRFPLHSYLTRNRIICKTLAQYKKAQRQLGKEEEEKN